jgi:hypothetical protein
VKCDELVKIYVKNQMAVPEERVQNIDFSRNWKSKGEMVPLI